MTDKEILEKAIDKVAKNGLYTKEQAEAIKRLNYVLRYELLIFAHSFAKAFWGNLPLMCVACEREHDSSGDCDAGMYRSRIYHWEYHLMQMVRKEEPLKYLEQFL